MKRPMTAKEHGDILDRDPKYQAMMAEKRKYWAEQLAILRKSEEPLVAELTAAGWPPNIKPSSEGGPHSVWNLVNTTEPYPHFLPILAKHLSRPYVKRVREAIVRALAVNEAKGTDIPHLLMDELKKETDPQQGPNSVRWVIINTLMFIGDASLMPDVQQLLEDPRYESVRADLQRLAKKLPKRTSGVWKRKLEKEKGVGSNTERGPGNAAL